MEYPLTNSKFVEIELEEEITTEQEKYPLSSRRPALGCFVYFRGFLFGRKCHSTARLNGKTVVITGGNTGIGKETALDLASRGAKVIIACRDVQKGYETVNDISEKVQKPDVVVKRLDLASFASIKSFAQDVLENEPYIHILINNAGVAACPKSLTEDGYEMQFGVNHLGHFLLTHLLLDRIKASVPARIINVSSIAHIYLSQLSVCRICIVLNFLLGKYQKTYWLNLLSGLLEFKPRPVKVKKLSPKANRESPKRLPKKRRSKSLPKVIPRTKKSIKSPIKLKRPSKVRKVSRKRKRKSPKRLPEAKKR
ncbi:retinol dehydrogenase 13-like isoform X3 [Argiope bruennichi]|uniref:retinol dehydrogenase 13-like isoform X3 n=1 Tax=Argiope bruennichi TaxID=94029 RepID=UPI0024958C41|nr:retinol dehydrogenase 13-like isoform X3 [Argiope bruennichi]